MLHPVEKSGKFQANRVNRRRYIMFVSYHLIYTAWCGVLFICLQVFQNLSIDRHRTPHFCIVKAFLEFRAESIMKRLFLSFCVALSGILAVSCYDDSALRAELADHESRISKLETLCKEMNTNISSLQTIVNAAASGDYITDVTPLMEGGEEVGYTITFAKNGKVTIYHGQDGKDGKDGQDGTPGKDGVDVGETPNIGIRLDEDGIYYWTLNGEWLLDDNGNKVKAVGSDGADGNDGADGIDGVDGVDGANGTDGKDGVDGVTPQLKIEDDYWYVSYDNGATWTRIGKATGEDGKDGVSGGDSIFSEVYQKDSYVYFILSNGDCYKVPTEEEPSLNIEFNVEQGVAIVPNTTFKVQYTITGAEGNTLVRVITTSSDLDESIAVAKPVDNHTGYIYIYFEGWNESEGSDELIEDGEFGNLTYGDYYESVLSLLVSVSDSKGNQILKALNYVEGVFDSVSDAYLADASSGIVSAVIKTNVNMGSYQVQIPEKAKSWLVYSPTKAEIREDVLNFNIAANENDKFRSATVKMVNEFGQTFESFTIVQRSENAGEVMNFADPRVKAICVGRYDKNLDGELTYEEVATVTDVDNLFLLDKNIVSFDEFKYFSSVTEIPDALFSNCEKLQSVTLPESLTTIGDNAFAGCTSLKQIIIPEGVVNTRYKYEQEGRYSGWFMACSSLESVTLPSTLECLPNEGFNGCSSLKSISIPEGISRIPYGCFEGCSQLAELIYKTPITSVGGRAFKGCSALKTFDFSALGINDGDSYSLGAYAFACSGIESAVLPETVIRIPEYLFSGCEYLSSVSLHDNVLSIGEGAFGARDEYDYETGDYMYTSCSNLKNIELPINLESIGPKAFLGSAITGNYVEESPIKVLVIPAKVTYIGWDAFANCSGISAVKMLPVYPPEINDNSFDRYTPIYVPADAVEVYKSLWYDEYTILPYEMMNVSLDLEFTMADNEFFDGYLFTFPITVKLMGNVDDIDNVSECGYYVKRDHYDASYYPVDNLEQNVTDTLGLSPDFFEVDFATCVAKADCQVGAYIRFVDGTIVTYDNQSVELVYDEELSASLLNVESGVSESEVSFWVEYTFEGQYWLYDVEVECEASSGSVNENVWSDDGKLIVTGYWNDYEQNATMTITMKYYDRNWTEKYAEPVVFTYDAGLLK